MVPVARKIRGSRPNADRLGAVLRVRLENRRAEIEQATLTRVYAISDPTETADPTYVAGLRAALTAALDYGFKGTEQEKESPLPSIPPALLVQARVAARNGVSLDTVLRRYFAGYTLLGDFIVEEAGQDELLNAAELKRLLGAQATLFDRLIKAVSEEYVQADDSRHMSADQRRIERVERLLAGELVDTTEFAYDLDAHHIGAIAFGPGAAEAIGSLAEALDCRPLVIERDERTVWAWLGSRGETDAEELERQVSQSWPAEVSLCVGETGQALAGWRLTHRQAKAALPIAFDSPAKLTRYADVALLASIRQDQVLVASLRHLYLTPLAETPDGGATLRKTLRAYFATGRNVSSAAAVLGVNRRTVANRIHAVEECIGRSFDKCAVDLQIALLLDETA